jgi:nucleoside phosphorylase
MTPPCLSAEDYTVGWVCALPVEHAAAALMLDERHQTPPKHATDSNTYLLGQIGVHNVVIVCLPSGRVGTNSAAAVASQMRSTFVSIEFVLIVGIGGGVPGAQADIRLGDVVISQPNSQYHGVVQYDFGKIGLGGRLTRTGSLNAPPTVLLSALATFQSSCLTYESGLSIHLAQLISHQKDFSPEKAGPDILFEPDYDHIEGQACDLCNKDRIVERPPRGRQEPVVHYGTIASGNVVMKDGVTRNLWSKDLGGVLCFEMEAAGLMNSFPCLVIRGICDYADSHKNKGWQPYAAATAAACTKDLLSVMSPGEAAKIHMQRKQSVICTQWRRIILTHHAAI